MDRAKGKQTRDEQPAAKANSRTKRKALSQCSNDDPFLGTSNPIQMVETGPTTFLRSLFGLIGLTKRKKSADGIPTAIRVVCRSASSTLIAAIDGQGQPANASAQRRAEATSSVCVAVSSSYRCILQSLESVSDRTHDEDGARSSIAEIVLLFQTVLGQLHALLIQEAESKRGVTQNPKRSTSRLKEVRAETQGLKMAGSDMCKSISRLLATMIKGLDLKREVQVRLFEGLTCAFLDHLGSSLSLVVFSDPENASESPVFTGLLPPQGLDEESDLSATIVLSTAQLEAPYLIYILKTLVKFTDNHRQELGSFSPSLLKHNGHSDPTTASLACRIQSALQNTLLRGVFGDEDETFQPCFRRAENASDMDVDEPATEANREEGTSEWFIGEVWSLLGWGILSGEGPPWSFQACEISSKGVR